MLLDHAAQVASAVDGAFIARWAKREEWQDFMQDAEQLALRLDRLGDGKLQDARRHRQARAQEGPARSPANPKHLDVREIDAKVPKEPLRYVMLLVELREIDCYKPLRSLWCGGGGDVFADPHRVSVRVPALHSSASQ